MPCSTPGQVVATDHLPQTVQFIHWLTPRLMTPYSRVTSGEEVRDKGLQLANFAIPVLSLSPALFKGLAHAHLGGKIRSREAAHTGNVSLSAEEVPVLFLVPRVCFRPVTSARSACGGIDKQTSGTIPA
ncbi:hypothetical protein BaRGS_00002875 [Batillaria attramentaria]|uniref:Uncharacterized protein n=1 Tax=Batillaria attramentaria TaxID=370345 RepID=A0ABD0M393_9CAEN